MNIKAIIPPTTWAKCRPDRRKINDPEISEVCPFD
jgi:hypothetical protein